MKTTDLGHVHLCEPLGHPILSPLVATFNEIGDEQGVDPCLLAAIAYNESSWNKLALSFDGNFGRGLMQIDAGFHTFAEQNVVYVTPTRYVDGAGRTGKAVDALASEENGALVFDAHSSLRYACENLIIPALRHYQTRADQVECAIASYNAGIGGVDSALDRGRGPESATYSNGYIDGILRVRASLADLSRKNGSK